MATERIPACEGRARSRSLARTDSATTRSNVSARANVAQRARERELFEHLFGAPARRVGVALEPLGVTPVPDRGVSFERLGRTWWISADPEVDPCRVDGQHVLPEEVLDRVGRLYAGGVRPHYLRVLHEVPDPAWSPGRPLPVLVPPARSLRAADAAILAGVRAVVTGAAAAAQGAGVVAGSLTSIAAVVAVAPIALLGDPILLGGVQVDADRVLWCELDRWTWT
jgi:hypothetical protein